MQGALRYGLDWTSSRAIRVSIQSISRPALTTQGGRYVPATMLFPAGSAVDRYALPSNLFNERWLMPRHWSLATS